MNVEDDFAGYQTIGKRAVQQDAYAFCPGEDGSLMLAVADGVGGQDSGEVASRTAVAAFFDAFFRIDETEPLARRMAQALQAANLAVGSAAADLAKANDGEVEIATTFTMVHYVGDEISWISVGDSPLYRISVREGTLARLNADHSMRTRLVEEVAAGGMAEGDAERHPARNSILSAVSGEKIEMVDQPEKALHLDAGDIILSASDGILSLSDDEILATVLEDADRSARRIARKLVSSVVAKNKRNQDNATVALVRHPG